VREKLLDYGLIESLFELHRAGRGDWSKHLWNVYTLSSWHDTWVAQVDPVVARDAVARGEPS
jgi:hypothetical protein